MLQDLMKSDKIEIGGGGDVTRELAALGQRLSETDANLAELGQEIMQLQHSVVVEDPSHTQATAIPPTDAKTTKSASNVTAAKQSQSELDDEETKETEVAGDDDTSKARFRQQASIPVEKAPSQPGDSFKSSSHTGSIQSDVSRRKLSFLQRSVLGIVTTCRPAIVFPSLDYDWNQKSKFCF